MCGIYACFHYGRECHYHHNTLTLRGPDETCIVDDDNFQLAFYRLAIMGVSEGHQPFKNGFAYIMCNGEIYNYEDLANKYCIDLKTGSDCEIISELYDKDKSCEWVAELDGEFAFIIVDESTGLIQFARDRMGIKPLYYNLSDAFELASEIKALTYTDNVQHVLPHRLYTYDINNRTISSMKYAAYLYSDGLCENTIIVDLYDAVIKRISQSEREIGFLLSGGLDSSIVLSIAMDSGILRSKPHVFTFGFSNDAPDVKAARVMVEWLEAKYGADCLDWHLVIQDVDDGINALPDVIYTLETYDTTTIRASTPMYLISKYISENTNVKVIISGEGADELFGGYLYFQYAPNEFAYRSEIKKLMDELYLFDVLRSDRTTAAWGLEMRPPFLDSKLIDGVYNIKARDKSEYTKELLRNSVIGLLPDAILWGKKEAFSDAVGLSWQDTIEEVAKSRGLTTKKLFKQMFNLVIGKKLSHLVPHYWVPNQDWVDTGGESSARVLSIY